METFEKKQYTVWITLIGVVGSSAMLVNSIYPNNTGAIISAAVGAGLAVLFVTLSLEMLVYNLKMAIQSDKEQTNNELVATVVAKAVYNALKNDEKKI